MTKIRKANERGRSRMGWLDSWHTFSFSSYYDPKQMGYRSLRVINDDIFGPGGGFPMHPHEDMEILTVVLSGAVRHGDSLGHEQLLRPGEVQRMSAGRGIVHSEYNASKTEPVRLLQIWLEPDKLADESPLVGTIQIILEGRFALFLYQGSAQGEPQHGLFTFGYNTTLDRYEASWVDSFHKLALTVSWQLVIAHPR